MEEARSLLDEEMENGRCGGFECGVREEKKSNKRVYNREFIQYAFDWRGNLYEVDITETPVHRDWLSNYVFKCKCMFECATDDLCVLLKRIYQHLNGEHEKIEEDSGYVSSKREGMFVSEDESYEYWHERMEGSDGKVHEIEINVYDEFGEDYKPYVIFCGCGYTFEGETFCAVLTVYREHMETEHKKIVEEIERRG